MITLQPTQSDVECKDLFSHFDSLCINAQRTVLQKHILDILICIVAYAQFINFEAQALNATRNGTCFNFA